MRIVRLKCSRRSTSSCRTSSSQSSGSSFAFFEYARRSGRVARMPESFRRLSVVFRDGLISNLHLSVFVHEALARSQEARERKYRSRTRTRRLLQLERVQHDALDAVDVVDVEGPRALARLLHAIGAVLL